MALENPALNERSFQRGIEEAEVAEPRGMTAVGTYAITGLLLVIVVAAAAFGWSQVEIVTVGGREETLTPAWTWLAFIEQAAAAGAPRFMQWYWAFGLMLSLIWIYVSVLRLLAFLRARQ